MDAGPRIRLLIERADRGECDLVVHGRVLDEMRGYLYEGGRFRSDRANSLPLSGSALRPLPLVPGQELTYTFAPPGSGVRMGIDRDLDGILDGDEDG